MTTIRRYSIDLDDPALRQAPVAGKAAPAGAIESFDANRHSGPLTALVHSCRGDGSGMTTGLRAEGLLAELTGRPGRSARGWVWGLDDVSIAGLVCLVESGAAERRRFSISWLIVAPSFRRCEVGFRLVLQALDEARSSGAVVVHAETKAEWRDATAFWDRLTDRGRGRSG